MTGTAKILGFIVGVGVVIGLVAGGALLLRERPVKRGGQGELITAPDEPYKVRPDEVGGMEIEGEGDAAFAASAGRSPIGRIDASAVPEEPIRGGPGTHGTAQPREGGATARIAANGERPETDGQRRGAADGSAPIAAEGRSIELGAFSTRASADRAWTAISGRYTYLAALGHSVSPLESGERTLFRLRVDTGSAEQARAICGRLRVAQEACGVVAD